MKFLPASSVLPFTLLVLPSLAVFKLQIYKHATRHLQIQERTPLAEALRNEKYIYSANITVGTPAQIIHVHVDTGSSDLWLLATTTDMCFNGNGCRTPFNPDDSSSYKLLKAGGFHITYMDKRGASGDFVTENLNIGGAEIKALQMGVAENSTVSGTGIMGIGYNTSETTTSIYPNLIDQMVNQGHIAHKAYSLWLDDLEASTGSVLFGGMDSGKYIGELAQLPIIPGFLGTRPEANSTDFRVLQVELTYIGHGTESFQTGSLTALLDSGTSLTYLPKHLFKPIFRTLNASVTSGYAWVDCSLAIQKPSATFDFTFSEKVTIKVPISEVINPKLGTDGHDRCLLGIQPISNDMLLGIDYALLGDTFLRSAYVVYDLQNNQIGLALTNFNSTTSNIIEFPANMKNFAEAIDAASSSQHPAPTTTMTITSHPPDTTSKIQSTTSKKDTLTMTPATVTTTVVVTVTARG